jgi:FkbM family methyltransferase
MFGLLTQCLRAFGLSGLFIYLQLKLNQTNRIKLPSIAFPISMRPTATDRITLKEIFIRREYDLKLPETFSVNVIVDAGANIGFTSIFFINQFPNARIFSIEPDDENFEYLKKNVFPYKTITPLKNALWNKKEDITIIDRGYGKRGIMIGKEEGTHTLKAISVSDLMREHTLDSIDILKMDIEGSEKEVFSENYEPWLSKTKCIVVELHDRMKKGCSKAVFTALSKYDFSLSIQGENLVFINNRFS